MTESGQSAKHDAARRAVDLVESGMIVGLGTGSTAALAVEEIAHRLQTGELRDIVGIPTSRATHQQANLLGLALTTLEDQEKIDLTIDGADEVDLDGNLIKGLGGALLREKIVASASERLVIVVDESKLVPLLGSKAPLPVEIVTFGIGVQRRLLRELGAASTLRQAPEGGNFTSDEGHYILDAQFPNGIADPVEIDRVLRAQPGVVEHGLFLGFKPEVVVGRPPK